MSLSRKYTFASAYKHFTKVLGAKSKKFVTKSEAVSREKGFLNIRYPEVKK